MKGTWESHGSAELRNRGAANNDLRDFPFPR